MLFGISDFFTLIHKLVTRHLFPLCSISSESRLIESVISDEEDNPEDDDVESEGNGVDNWGLSDLLVGLSSMRGSCLTSLALLTLLIIRQSWLSFSFFFAAVVALVMIGEIPVETEFDLCCFFFTSSLSCAFRDFVCAV